MKRYDCKICGKYAAKRKTCKKCKEDFPFKTSGQGAYPFSRLGLYHREMEKKAREVAEKRKDQEENFVKHFKEEEILEKITNEKKAK